MIAERRAFSRTFRIQIQPRMTIPSAKQAKAVARAGAYRGASGKKGQLSTAHRREEVASHIRRGKFVAQLLIRGDTKGKLRFHQAT
jgi:hypothetical protein